MLRIQFARRPKCFRISVPDFPPLAKNNYQLFSQPKAYNLHLGFKGRIYTFGLTLRAHIEFKSP